MRLNLIASENNTNFALSGAIRTRRRQSSRRDTRPRCAFTRGPSYAMVAALPSPSDQWKKYSAPGSRLKCNFGMVSLIRIDADSSLGKPGRFGLCALPREPWRCAPLIHPVLQLWNRAARFGDGWKNPEITPSYGRDIDDEASHNSSHYVCVSGAAWVARMLGRGPTAGLARSRRQ